MVVVGFGVTGAAVVVGTVVGPSVGGWVVEGGGVCADECETFVGLAVTPASGVHAVAVRAIATAPPIASQRRTTPARVVTCCMVFPCRERVPLRAPLRRVVPNDRTLNRVTR